MDQERYTYLKNRADVMKALGHPTRLCIIEELEQGERCVCELTEVVGADISTVSRHLSVLRTAGLIVDEKRANQVFYRLRVPCIMQFFGCVESVLAARLHEATAGSEK